jgi:hypothetical protein
MPRMRRPLAAPDQRHVAQRQPRCALEPAERHVLDEGQDLAPEGGEVGELAALR